MNKPESSLDEWRKEAQRLACHIEAAGAARGRAGRAPCDNEPRIADLARHLAAHPSNQVLQEPVARDIEDCPELNLSNYDAEDVARLNDWAVRADAEIDRLAPTPLGSNLHPVMQDALAPFLRVAASPQAVPSEQPIAEQPKSLESYPTSASGGDDLPPALPRWIPVSELMPPQDEFVLITYRHAPRFNGDEQHPVWIARFNGATWWDGEDQLDGDPEFMGVTHWMPLPPAPGESAGEVQSDKKYLPSMTPPAASLPVSAPAGVPRGSTLALSLAIQALEEEPPMGKDWPVNWPVIVYGLKELKAALEQGAAGCEFCGALREVIAQADANGAMPGAAMSATTKEQGHE